MKKLFSCLAVSVMCVSITNAQVVINEFMQSNIDCIMDDLNDFPDSWVELYNAGSAPVNMSEFSIGTSRKASKAYKLPKQTLNAKGYALVYCDKEEKSWHTSFRLESGKDCAIYLFRNGEIADSIPSGLKKQPAPNIAYGRTSDGASSWGYMAVPTPKAENCGETYSKILGNPVFSVPGMVYSEKSKSISLELSLPDDSPEGTEIRYTTDGTEPTQSSAKYTAPITFSSTKVVRAKLFCDGYLSPRSLTQSYIMLGRKPDLAVVSVVSDKKYFTDSKIGIFSDSKSFDGTENYKHNWRRPVNYELFETMGEESKLNQLCETRVTGGATRSFALKSMGFYANKRFGEKRFSYEFFPDQRPGSTDFKSVMMRNAGNDFDYLYMRDAVIQRIMAENVDIDWQAWRPAIFFLNGQYKGILNIRERSNEDNIYTNYDGLEDIDMVENWNELKEGDYDEWQAFVDFYQAHGHSYEEYDKIMDVREFMNVMILNLFFCNLDFPGNNIVWWKPQAEGGRWRVIVKDTDFGLGLYGRSVSYNTIKWLYDPNYDKENAWANRYEHTRLFRRLMEDERFSREFIDRCAIYMGDFMNFDRTWEIWEPMYNLIRNEYPIHRKLYNEWWPNYNNELANAKTWLKNRPTYFYKHINDYYKVGMPVKLTINQSLSSADLSRIAVSFNDVRLTRAKFDGRFFAGRSISLTGENVTGWTITEVSSTGESSTKKVTGTTLAITMPNATSVSITAEIGQANGIEQVTDDDAASEITDVYDVSGIRRNAIGQGCNIVRTEDGKMRTVINKK